MCFHLCVQVHTYVKETLLEKIKSRLCENSHKVIAILFCYSHFFHCLQWDWSDIFHLNIWKVFQVCAFFCTLLWSLLAWYTCPRYGEKISSNSIAVGCAFRFFAAVLQFCVRNPIRSSYNGSEVGLNNPQFFCYWGMRQKKSKQVKLWQGSWDLQFWWRRDGGSPWDFEGRKKHLAKLLLKGKRAEGGCSCLCWWALGSAGLWEPLREKTQCSTCSCFKELSPKAPSDGREKHSQVLLQVSPYLCPLLQPCIVLPFSVPLHILINSPSLTLHMFAQTLCLQTKYWKHKNRRFF